MYFCNLFILIKPFSKRCHPQRKTIQICVSNNLSPVSSICLHTIQLYTFKLTAVQSDVIYTQIEENGLQIHIGIIQKDTKKHILCLYNITGCLSNKTMLPGSKSNPFQVQVTLDACGWYSTASTLTPHSSIHRFTLLHHVSCAGPLQSHTMRGPFWKGCTFPPTQQEHPSVGRRWLIAHGQTGGVHFYASVWKIDTSNIVVEGVARCHRQQGCFSIFIFRVLVLPHLTGTDAPPKGASGTYSVSQGKKPRLLFSLHGFHAYQM